MIVIMIALTSVLLTAERALEGWQNPEDSAAHAKGEGNDTFAAGNREK